MKAKEIDLAAMIISPILASLIVLYLHTNLLLISTLLFFGLPSLYIICRNPGILAKSLIFAVPFAVILSVVFDIPAALNGAYVIPRTIFPFKIFGISTVELYLFAFFWTFFSVLFYEHFFDHGRSGDRISFRFKKFLYYFISLSVFIIAAWYLNRNLLYIPYFYFIGGMIFVVLPLIFFLRRYPKFLPRLVVVSIYFFYALIIYELVALRTNEWIFPGKQFVGIVEILGYKFPLEELLIWMIACTPSLLAYYEFFADDRRLKSK